MHFRSDKKIQKILLVLIGVGLVLLATYWWWVPRVDVTYMLWGMHNDKSLNTVPTPIELSSTSVPGKSYTFDSIRFVAPWSDESRVERASNGYSLTVNFGPLRYQRYTRSLILLRDPSLRDILLQQTPQTQTLFGSTLATNYDAYAYVVHLTPSDINLFGPASVSLPKVYFLSFKSVMVTEGGGALNSFETKHGIRGFFASKDASTTIAEFFTPSDQEYTAVLEGATPAERDSLLNAIQEN